jgi:MATE family multidrug resistance protein
MRARFSHEVQLVIRFLPALATVAVPLVINRVGHMSLSVIDTMMAGRLGEIELAAVGMGATTYFFMWVFGMGILMGIDPFVSQAIGRGDEVTARRGLTISLVVALVCGTLLSIFCVHISSLLLLLGYDAHLVSHVDRYLSTVAFGGIPVMVFMAISTYMSARADTRLLVVATVIANLGNIVGNVLFTLGWFGAPRLGVVGIGIATVLSQIAEVLFLFWVLRPSGPRASVLPPSLVTPIEDVRWVLRAGAPVALQYVLEYTGFAAGTFLMAFFGAAALAGHHVALNVASVTFTFALGVSSAASALVGQAWGRGDRQGVRTAAYASWFTGIAGAALGAVVMIGLRTPIAELYTAEPSVLAAAVSFLTIAAFFQFADTTQAIGFGICRGMGDTAMPAAINAVAYWMCGMPMGIWLAFGALNRPEPLWWGFTASLSVVAILLVWRFRVVSARLGDHRLEPVEPALQGGHVGAE